jgi:hypothetical protein
MIEKVAIWGPGGGVRPKEAFYPFEVNHTFGVLL